MKIFARFILIFTLLLISICLSAAPQNIWSIGRPDESGAELGIFGKYSEFSGKYTDDWRFFIGKSLSSDWPYVHPGPEDAWAGNKQHRLVIEFDLESVPTGDCELVIDAVCAHAAAPVIKTEVNGVAAKIRFTSGNISAVGDESLKQPQQSVLRFKPDLLRAGKNEIALTGVSGSWLLYDAIRLRIDPQSSESIIRIISAQPNLCWIRKPDSSEAQSLTAVVSCTQRSATVDAVAQTGTASVKTQVNLKFGENRLTIPIPDIEAATTITLSLGNGADQQKTQIICVPQRKWKLFLVPSIHTDIGYTDRQEKVFARHNENLDKVLEMMRKQPDRKWNVEVSWELANYLAARPKEARAEIIGMLKSGRIGLQAGYLNFLTSLMSDEAMNRFAWYSARLRREHGIPFSTALMTDIPSATWALSSTMAASGIRGFAQGCNSDRGPLIPHCDIKTPFYWEGPDGSRLLTWLSNGYAQTEFMATAQDLAMLEEKVSSFLKWFDSPDYPFDAAYGYGAFADNCPMNQNYGKLVTEWNKTYAYPKLIMDTGAEFFSYLEEHYAGKIPVKRGDFGAFWEDGAGSTAFETILHMENQRRIEQAQALWAMAQISGSKLPCPQDGFNQAWDDILFYIEHTWGAAESVRDPDSQMTRDQWNYKADYARGADRKTRELHSEALQAYIQSIVPGGKNLVVVNTLSWQRSGMFQLPESIPPGMAPADESGNPLPLQAFGKNRFALAIDIPAFGSRTYQLVSAGNPSPAASPGSFENRFYRVALDNTRGIASIIDLDTGRQLVDKNSPYLFGQILYASGGENTGLAQHGNPDAQIVMNTSGRDPLRPENGTLLLTNARIIEAKIAESGALWTDALIRSSAPSMPQVETRVRLYNNEKRISFEVNITSKTEIRRKEAVYTAFPFAIGSPQFRLGMTKATTDPAKDFIHGACHELYCVQDFVSCRAAADRGECEVLWSSPDAPLVALSDVNRGRWLADAELARGTILSYVMNNYWHTNYKAGQGGDFRFRYEIASSGRDFSNDECLRFSRSAATPLHCMAAQDNPESQTASILQKTLEVSGEGVIAAILPSDIDSGIVIRLRNARGSAATAYVKWLGKGSVQFELTSVTEDFPKPAGDGKNVCVVPLNPQQTATLRAIPGAVGGNMKN